MAAAPPAVNVDDARGLAFACLPGCGFCCTAAPLVHPQEAGPLGPLVVRAADGALRIPQGGVACSSLRGDRTCGVYERRPAVCRVYPYSVHAGRRVQATVSLACPGTLERGVPHQHHEHALHPARDADDMAAGAREVAAMALALPGAAETAARAKETFSEFDRRMREWGVAETPDRLRAAFLPHADALARPESLPAVFAGLGEGDLVLGGRAPRAVAALFDADPETGLAELVEAAAREAFEGCEDALWVEPDGAWTVPRWRDGAVVLARHAPGAAPREREVAVGDAPLLWTEEGSSVLARYLARLCHRDHAEGAAAWVVDASGYQATPAAAYGRVLAEAALQVVLRAGLLAAEEGAEAVGAREAARGVAAYETSFHSLPTLGAIL